MDLANKNSVDKMVDLLSKEGSQTTFVFTSEVVARSYLEACARKYENQAIFEDSAISWDTFQEKFTPYPREKVRAIFTDRLLFVQQFFATQNAMSKLKYYCDSNYSCSKPAYMRSIAKALPNMCKAFDLSTMELLDKVSQQTSNEMQADLKLLVPAYKAYLEEHGLYDTALYEPNFNATASDGTSAQDYTLVFPQTFSKAAVLKALKVCKHIDLEPQEEGLKLKLYNNSLSEIRACLRNVYTLLSSGTRPNDIAITCSDYDAYKPYLDQEAQKRDITLTFNNAKPIPSYTPGAFFCALERVKGENYSFKSMKNLLLDLQFPYKDRDLLVSILQKAVDCKCKDGPLFTWINKFKKLKPSAAVEAKRLSEIDKGIRAVVDCKDPLKLKENVMILIKDLFGEDKWTKEPEEDDGLEAQNARIFGSCEHELDNLSTHAKGIELGKDGDLFGLFVDIIKDTVYRPNTGKNNINVYRYPVSAGLAVKYHFTLGLTDSNTKVLLNPYPFLPLDTAKTMEEVKALEDSVLSLYGQTLGGGVSWMSSAEEGFSGADVVPTLFLKGKRIERINQVDQDSFSQEVSVWEGKEGKEGKEEERGFAITQKQKACFERACESELKFDNRLDFGQVDLPFKISVSRVKEFEGCPYRGYLACKLKLKDVDFEPNMTDAMQIGNLLHEALQEALKQDGTLESVKKETLLTCFEKALNTYQLEPKATDSVHLEFIRRRYSEFLPKLVECFYELEDKKKKNLDYYTLEKLGSMDFKDSEYVAPALACGNVRFEGRMDCILEDGDGNLAVIDLKKNAKTHHGGSLDKVNLQVAIYANMLQQDPKFRKRPIIGAFYSFQEGKFYFVWPKFGYNKSHNNFFYDRNSISTDPQPKGDKLEFVDENFNKRVSELDRIVSTREFIPKLEKSNCENCPYPGLCRGGFQTV